MKKTVVITGCSSGFGLHTVHKFHKEGWNVVGIVRKLDWKITSKIPKEVYLVELDITHLEKIPKVIEGIVKVQGAIHTLINNAGVGSIGLLEQHDEKVIRQVFEVNVFSMINLTKAVLPYMRKQGEGTIINISSVRGIIGASLKSVYAATKFAVQGFSESLALEVHPLNIKVKTVIPNAFPTNFKANCMENTHLGDGMLKEYAQKLIEGLDQKKNLRSKNNPQPDPKEVADKIFECTTTNTPMHNFVGWELNKEDLFNHKECLIKK